VAKVVYDADGTKDVTVRGERVSSQIFPDGRGMVIAFDAGEPVEMFQCRSVWSVHKKRAPTGEKP
jgi:hypothetical protein